MAESKSGHDGELRMRISLKRLTNIDEMMHRLYPALQARGGADFSIGRNGSKNAQIR
jgi:hypothetical protein